MKFRTLYVHAEFERTVAPEDDPRITPSGRWLRRWRLDEFPQLFNILKGDMSLVGPRPMPLAHAKVLTASQRDELFAVRPGLTDPAAIHFLAEDAVLAGHVDANAIYTQKLLPVKVEMQLDYIRRGTLLRDLHVLFRTLLTLWSRTERRRSTEALRRLLK